MLIEDSSEEASRESGDFSPILRESDLLLGRGGVIERAFAFLRDYIELILQT